MPWLNRVCCCIPLETGGMIMGILSLVYSIVGTITSTTTVINKIKNPGQPNDNTTRPWEVDLITALLYLFSIAFAALVIHAIRRQRPKLMLPYLIVQGIQSAIGAIFTVIIIFVALTAANKDTVGPVIAIIFIALCGLALNAYIWACVYSVYQKLRDDENAGTTYSSMT